MTPVVTEGCSLVLTRIVPVTYTLQSGESRPSYASIGMAEATSTDTGLWTNKTSPSDALTVTSRS